MSKAVIYARVSPTKEVNTAEGMAKSIANQIEKCKVAIERDKHELVEIYKDQYVSGKDNDYMKDFQRLKDDAILGKYDLVYCLRDDRLGRSQYDAIALIEELERGKMFITRKALVDGKEMLGKFPEILPHAIHFVFVEEGISTNTDDGKMMVGVVSSFSERQRKRIIENTTRGREALKKRIAEAREKGLPIEKNFGRKPIEIPWDYVLSLRQKDKSFTEIAKRLRDLGGKLSRISAATLIRKYNCRYKEETKTEIKEQL